MLFVLLLTLVLTLSFVVVSEAFVKGEKVKVLWKGKWHLATVLTVRGDLTYVHYNGYRRSWNEWVGPDRIRSYRPAPVAVPPPPPAPAPVAAPLPPPPPKPRPPLPPPPPLR
ncbi:hypothetical protein E2O03_003175 [Candidatus Magnetomonas plexicatena]|nr:hypothetical protein E2O03_003175 [Nitrospirales bacterium LBB_01]